MAAQADAVVDAAEWTDRREQIEWPAVNVLGPSRPAPFLKKTGEWIVKSQGSKWLHM